MQNYAKQQTLLQADMIACGSYVACYDLVNFYFPQIMLKVVGLYLTVVSKGFGDLLHCTE